VTVSRPAVSQHLAVLERARLVRHRKRGTRHIYHPDPAGLAPLRAYVESLWDHVLVAFASAGAWNGGNRDEVEHAWGWERLGEKAAVMRAGYDGGWDFVLGRYAG